MIKCSTIIVDDFYKDPYKIREDALSSSYLHYPHDAFPGIVSTAKHRQTKRVTEKIAQILGDASIDWRKGTPAFGDSFCGHFRILRQQDKTPFYAHAHQRGFTGLVYLSLPHQCRGGTVILRHKKTGLMSPFVSAENGTRFHQAFRKIRKSDYSDPRQWETVLQVEMRFNRLFIFNSRLFHSWSAGFGEQFRSYRITQLFNFDILN